MRVPSATYLTSRDLNDRYTSFLACVLLGYAMLGKGFAYLGLPPLFIGEITLAAGLVIMFRTGAVFAALTRFPMILLSFLLLWVLWRTLPTVGIYRFDALRDSVIVVYGLFAFIVVALLLDKPERLNDILRWFAFFTMIYGVSGPFLYFFEKAAADVIPMVPGADTPLLNIRSGEVAVHVSAAAVFALLGMRKAGRLWVAVLLVGIAMIAAQSRGGMLAILGPVAFAFVVGGRWKSMIQGLLAATVLLGLAYALDVEIPLPGGERPLGARQVVDNFLSVFSQSQNAQLDGTKQWRVHWWQYIQKYTFHGEYFWTGKGFGINLAEADGFVVGEEAGAPLVRVPHSAHMTILARSGVPGLLLWALTLSSVLVALLWNMFTAKRRGDETWANLFLFLFCYLTAFIINSSFDVALEGPMLGIWFWVLFGISVGSTMIYRAQWSVHGKWPTPALLMVIGSTLLFAASGSKKVLAEDTLPSPGSAIESATGSCLTLTGARDIVIMDLRIGPCAGHGIELIDSERVTIRNVEVRDAKESSIYVLGSRSVEIVGSRLIGGLTGIAVVHSEQVRVDCNTIEDPRGPIPSGQFVQFNNVIGSGNRISCNVGRNHPGKGSPEDAISLYQSSGEPASPIEISHNLIVGGGPSPSGGGIMLGDDGGSHVIARSNVLVDPGQYGIAVASGTNIAILDNTIYGREQPFTNVGIYAWNQYDEVCTGITVRGNRVNWTAGNGTANPWWDGERSCGVIQGIEANDFAAPIGPDVQDATDAKCSCPGTVGRQ